MKKVIFLLVFVFLLSLTPIKKDVIAQTIVGENQLSDYLLIQNLPIPDFLPEPYKMDFVEIIAALVSYSQIAGQKLQIPGLSRYAQQGIIAMTILQPKMVQDSFIPKTEETGPAAEAAGKACVYLSASGTLYTEVPALSNTVKSDTKTNTILRQIRQALEWENTIRGRNTITKDGSVYDQKEPVYEINREVQQPCSKRVPGQLTEQEVNDSKDKAQWIRGIGKPLVSYLEWFCGICDCCTEYDIFVDKTILQSNMKQAYRQAVGGSKGGLAEEKVNYYVDPKLEEITAGQGGTKDTVRPGSFFEKYWKMDESILGKTKQQEFKTDGFGSKYSDTAFDFHKAIQTSEKFTDCMILPQSLQSSYFSESNEDGCKRKWPTPNPTPTQDIFKPKPMSQEQEEARREAEPDIENPLQIPQSADGPRGNCADKITSADDVINNLNAAGDQWIDRDVIRQNFSTIYTAAKTAGYDPALVLGIWFEESGAGKYPIEFGCTKAGTGFTNQLGCFLNLWTNYATQDRFQECRGDDNKLNLREFMLLFEGGYKSCRSGQFGTEPKFPEKIKGWYDKITGCKDGLVF